MPKHKKKRKFVPVVEVKSSNASNADENRSDFDENESTISNPSSNLMYQDLENDDALASTAQNAGSNEDLQNRIDNIEVQITASLQGLQEKGFKEREDALKVLNKLFASKYLLDHLIDKRFTLVECAHRSLKRGKLSEQLLAVQNLTLLLVQYGYSADSEYIMSETKETMINLIKNDKTESSLRAACCTAIGVGIFIVNESPAQITETMDLYESLFQGSYLKGDGTVRQHTREVYQLHASALSSWTLLFTILPMNLISKVILKRIEQFQEFLKCSDTDLRIVAGETIAILFEIGHCDANLDISSIDNSELIEILNNLSKESGKSKSKKDRRIQHSSFRDILRTIEDGELPDVQSVKFGHNEEVILDSWVRIKHYKAFRDLIGTGITSHLQENELLRDIFDLGMPLIEPQNSTKSNANKATKLQRVQENRERFRHRTKNMSKKREQKRTVEHDTVMTD